MKVKTGFAEYFFPIKHEFFDRLLKLSGFTKKSADGSNYNVIETLENRDDPSSKQCGSGTSSYNATVTYRTIIRTPVSKSFSYFDVCSSK